jgi:hypothetical protein
VISPRTALAVLALSALSVFLALGASWLALKRPAFAHLSDDIQSRLSADYSIDLVALRLNPVDPRIIQAASEDESNLVKAPAQSERAPPANVTPTPTAAAKTGAEQTPRPGATPQATNAPGSTSTPKSATPAPNTPTPRPGATSTPKPPESPVDTPVPEPTATVPVATATLVPTLTPTLTPTPVPTLPPSATATPTKTPGPPPTKTPTPTLPDVDGGVPCLPLGSGPQIVDATIYFRNRSDISVRIYWIDPTGDLVLRATLEPGEESKEFETHVGDRWAVYTTSGVCIEHYVVGPGKNKVDIE